MAELIAGNRGLVAGIERSPLQTLRAWQSAIGIAVRFGRVDADGWGRTHRWANPPREPDVVDRLLKSVEPLITAPHLPEAVEVLESWMREAGSDSPHADTFDRITQPSSALQPIIDEVLRQHGRAHTRIRRRLTDSEGKPIAELPWNSEAVPQLAWPCALPEALRRNTRPDHRILRTVLSMTLVRWRGGADDWATAGTVLGIPPSKARGWARYAYADRWNLKTALLEAAESLLPVLPHQPAQGGWRLRPALGGNGLVAFRGAQQPGCRRDEHDSTWCPCTDTNQRETG